MVTHCSSTETLMSPFAAAVGKVGIVQGSPVSLIYVHNHTACQISEHAACRSCTLYTLRQDSCTMVRICSVSAWGMPWNTWSTPSESSFLLCSFFSNWSVANPHKHKQWHCIVICTCMNSAHSAMHLACMEFNHQDWVQSSLYCTNLIVTSCCASLLLTFGHGYMCRYLWYTQVRIYRTNCREIDSPALST